MQKCFALKRSFALLFCYPLPEPSVFTEGFFTLLFFPSIAKHNLVKFKLKFVMMDSEIRLPHVRAFWLKVLLRKNKYMQKDDEL